MGSWSRKELTQIANAETLSLVTVQRDGTPGDPVTLGVVCVAGEPYVRAYRGPGPR